MRRQTETESNSKSVVFFQCVFWLMLAIAVTGCDGVTLSNLGLGGIDQPTTSGTANPESYALIGQRDLDVAAGSGVMANDADAIAVLAGSMGTTFGGTLQLHEDGSFSYSAPTDFFGTDSFEYIVELEDGMMTGTASIKVYPADATPVP